MKNLNNEDIVQKLKSYQDSYLKMDLVQANIIEQIAVSGNAVDISLRYGFPVAGISEEIVRDVTMHVMQIPGVQQVNVKVSHTIRAHKVPNGLLAVPGIKNIIAVASGKGGVGKSTTAANLALALHAAGARVGILDADIYGPNQPHILGAKTRPEVTEAKKIKPLICHGLQTMSIGFLVDIETPMVWRGPMVSSALTQLFNDTLWDNLDYLVIDLPPGTGDIQLTLSKKVPVSGAVLITTPQDIALLDVRKGYEMFRKVDVSVLGLIENMSVHICKKCGHEEHLFGEKGGVNLANVCDIELLGQMPLDILIREAADAGTPTVVREPNSELAKKYQKIALKIAAKLSLREREYSSKFGKITVE